jgi:hypothetical protein
MTGQALQWSGGIMQKVGSSWVVEVLDVVECLLLHASDYCAEH